MTARTMTAVAAVVAVMLALGFAIGRWSAPPSASSTAETQVPQKRLLYYRNPMGLPDTSPVPKKDSMGMDYIPVYEGDDASTADGGIALSPARIQTLGVRTETVQRQPWSREIRALGRLLVDETALSTVTTRYDGWIEQLHVDAVGDVVHAGQPLLTLYSPELMSAQQEYLIALDAGRRLREADASARDGAERLRDAARQRLRNWDFGPAQIAALERRGTASRTVTLHAATAGTVTERFATRGMRVAAGDRLFEIADLDRLWLQVDVFAQDLDAVQLGATATIDFGARGGAFVDGTIEFIYPTLDEATRTTRVRIAVDNADGRLRPGMFATARISRHDDAPVLTVPDLALLDTGSRQQVIVALGNGRFAPREVQAGRRADGRVEILSGLDAGEQVVTRANFLIDAESNLRSAASGLDPQAGSADGHGDHAAPQGDHGTSHDGMSHDAHGEHAAPAPADPHAAHGNGHAPPAASAAADDPHAAHRRRDSAPPPGTDADAARDDPHADHATHRGH